MSVPAHVAPLMTTSITYVETTDIARGAPDLITSPDTTRTHGHGLRALGLCGAWPTSSRRQRIPTVIALLVLLRCMLRVALVAEMVPLRRRNGGSFAPEAFAMPAFVAHVAHGPLVHGAAVVAHEHPSTLIARTLSRNWLLTPAVVTVILGRVAHRVRGHPNFLEQIARELCSARATITA